MSGRLLAITLATLALAACSGSGASAPVPAAHAPANPSAASTAPPGESTGTVSIVIHRGGAASSSATRRPQFVSGSTSSVGISINGGTPAYADVSANSSLCTTAGSTQTCSIPIAAPAGADTIALSLYDGVDGTGNLLGTGQGTTTVTLGSAWTVTVPIAGVAASVAISASPLQTILSPSLLAQAVTVSANDADGNPITGSLAAAIPVTVYDPAHVFTVSLSSITTVPQTLTVTYSGGTFIHAVVTLGSNTGSFGGAMSFVASSAPHHLAISNYALGQIPVYYIGGIHTWTGTTAPTTSPQWLLSGLSGPTGVAADTSGNLYVPNKPLSDPNGATSLDIYAAGASGNATPMRSLSGFGPGYGYWSPALDASGNVYDYPYTGTINVFASGASGAAAPASSITFSPPCTYPTDDGASLTIDPTHNLLFTLCYTANSTTAPSILYEFPTSASGLTTPTRAVSIPDPYGSGGIGVDANGNAVVFVYNTVSPELCYVPAGSTTAVTLGAPDVIYVPNIDDGYITVDAAGFIYLPTNDGGTNVYAPYPATVPNPTTGLIEPIDRIFDSAQATAISSNYSPNNSAAIVP